MANREEHGAAAGVWDSQLRDRSQTIDSKDGEMSEWRSTLGNRFRPRLLTYPETH